MAAVPWLPIGFPLPGGMRTGRVLFEGEEWQICAAMADQTVLVARDAIAHRWRSLNLTPLDLLSSVRFGEVQYWAIASGPGLRLAPIRSGGTVRDRTDAFSFADALRATRAAAAEIPLHDGILVERIGRILPTFTLSEPLPDDVVLGSWLTGGVQVSVRSARRIVGLTGWMKGDVLGDVIRRAGLSDEGESHPDGTKELAEGKREFRLTGRPSLEEFLREHVIDIVENEARYKALGISFPSAIVLHGPPGCGKTFAVERLVEHLGWPSYSIEASSVASPYIHETSRKIAEVFEKAIENAPSVLVIDEMEAFLADRQAVGASGHHRVEEVAEFLRRIPEATSNRVLVVAMTNMIEMIDPAILRRGRFDHVVEVGMPSQAEVEALMAALLAKLPCEGDFDLPSVAKRLAGRPLSDVSFVAREAARLAARDGKSAVSPDHLARALAASQRGEAEWPTRRIGFVRDDG